MRRCGAQLEPPGEHRPGSAQYTFLDHDLASTSPVEVRRLPPHHLLERHHPRQQPRHFAPSSCRSFDAHGGGHVFTGHEHNNERTLLCRPIRSWPGAGTVLRHDGWRAKNLYPLGLSVLHGLRRVGAPLRRVAVRRRDADGEGDRVDGTVRYSMTLVKSPGGTVRRRRQRARHPARGTLATRTTTSMTIASSTTTTTTPISTTTTTARRSPVPRPRPRSRRLPRRASSGASCAPRSMLRLSDSWTPSLRVGFRCAYGEGRGRRQAPRSSARLNPGAEIGGARARDVPTRAGRCHQAPALPQVLERAPDQARRARGDSSALRRPDRPARAPVASTP